MVANEMIGALGHNSALQGYTGLENLGECDEFFNESCPWLSWLQVEIILEMPSVKKLLSFCPSSVTIAVILS